MTRIAQNLSRRLVDGWHSWFGPAATTPVGPVVEPVEAAGLRAVCLNAWPGDEALGDAWDALARAALGRAPQAERLKGVGATAFHTYAWQRAVAETLVRPGRLRLLVVWEGGELVAAVALRLADDGGLETVAPHITDYLDPLIRPGREADALPLVLALAARVAPGRPLTLHNVRDAATCRGTVGAAAAARGVAYDERAHEFCPAIALPRTWDAFLARLDPHERKEVRRKVNKAMRDGRGRVVRCGRDACEVAAALPVALGMMQQARGAKGADVRRTLRPVLERAAPALIAGGQLCLTTLYVEDEAAACALHFPHADGPQLYNCGFAAGRREWSPGVVLLAELIREAIGGGAATFDLLRGQEAYKYRWGARDRALWTVRVG